MSYTLLLRLVGPQQSWGTSSRFDRRDSELAPTKSGVVGLLAAALGYPRKRDVTDLAALRMGVRVDRRGTLMSDYHTALEVLDTGGKTGTVVSERHYLADAAFVVGLEGADPGFLHKIHAALLNPHWPLALGRRAFPPSLPVGFSEMDEQSPIVEAPLSEALLQCRPVIRESEDTRERWLLIIEDPDGTVERFDQPLDNFSRRTFGPRRVKMMSIERSQP